MRNEKGVPSGVPFFVSEKITMILCLFLPKIALRILGKRIKCMDKGNQNDKGDAI